MKIYFLIEIALLLAVCLTAVIVTIKNVKLRKIIRNQQLSIKDLTKINYDDMLKKVSLQNECSRLIFENGRLKNNLLTVTAPLPERREKESDAQYFKRCRQVVANKAATYAKVNDRITLRVISHD